MKKKIVILGATGTVGSKISEILLNEGHAVTLIARHTEKLERFRPIGAEIIAGDVNDTEVLTNAFKNADSAFLSGTATEIAGVESVDAKPFKKEWKDSIGAAVQEAYRCQVLDRSFSYVII